MRSVIPALQAALCHAGTIARAVLWWIGYNKSSLAHRNRYMNIITTVLIILVALLHVYIMILEMVLWAGPRGQKAFGLTADFARSTKALAANQGLYNGFLAAGLFWSVLHPDAQIAWQLALFFLACVAVAGMFGAATASRKIFFIQTVPAVIAMLAVVFL